MRNLLLTLVLVCSAASAQIIPEQANNNQGQSFFRLYNNTPYYISCYYKDNYNYITFTIAPRNTSFWYPVYGFYIWECQ